MVKCGEYANHNYVELSWLAKFSLDNTLQYIGCITITVSECIATTLYVFLRLVLLGEQQSLVPIIANVWRLDRTTLATLNQHVQDLASYENFDGFPPHQLYRDVWYGFKGVWSIGVILCQRW